MVDHVLNIDVSHSLVKLVEEGCNTFPKYDYK